MFHLTQYIVVRRDLPLEVIPVYVAHAAGLAMFAYSAKLAVDHPEARWDTLNPDWGFPSRIVRGAKNEGRLKRLASQLRGVGLSIVEVMEPDDGPYKGQLLSLATFPGEKTILAPLLNDFQDLRYKDVPDFLARGGKP